MRKFIKYTVEIDVHEIRDVPKISMAMIRHNKLSEESAIKYPKKR